jgi:hypothetical protein
MIWHEPIIVKINIYILTLQNLEVPQKYSLKSRKNAEMVPVKEKKNCHKSGANSTLICKDRSHATKFFSHSSQIGYTVLMIKFWRSPKSHGKIKLKAVLEVFRPAESVSGLNFVFIGCGDMTHASLPKAEYTTVEPL